MKAKILVCLMVFIGLFAQSDEGVLLQPLGKQPIQIQESDPINPSRFPTEVRNNPDIQLKTGTPPVMPTLEIEQIRQSLKPQTAKKLENVKMKRAGRVKEISFSRAEAMASYKAMLQKQLAEQKLKEMIKRGATDEEIETFKIQTEEQILQTRWAIMKAFGTSEELKEAEEAIMKFNSFKTLKAKEE